MFSNVVGYGQIEGGLFSKKLNGTGVMLSEPTRRDTKSFCGFSARSFISSIAIPVFLALDRKDLSSLHYFVMRANRVTSYIKFTVFNSHCFKLVTGFSS